MSGNIKLLSDTLAAAKAEGRSALIAYLPAGFPTVDGGIEAAKAVFDGGADVVEIGLPHSDPVLDGPVIQTADDIALRGGVKIADVMRTVREAHEATGKPVLVMTYWNPIDRYGIERFTAELAEAGGAGCILPDLPVQESATWREHADKHGLATVFVVAPSSKDARLAEITAAGLRLCVRRLADGRHGHPRVRRRAGAGPGAAHPGHHRAAGLCGPRGLQRRTGRRGGPVRGRGDRGLGVRQAAAVGGRRPGGQASPGSVHWRESWPRACVRVPRGRRARPGGRDGSPAAVPR